LKVEREEVTRPLIGITCSRRIVEGWAPDSPGDTIDYTFEEYSKAIRHCGGAPVLIPVAQNRETLWTILDRIAGLLLSGGPDIHPKSYHEQPLPELGEVDEDLDRMELEIAKAAFQRNLPILAICRGVQVLNVSRGGTLYQDIPTQVQDSINHLQNVDKTIQTHTICIERKTLLHRIFRKTEIWVNGKHHQAIKDLAPDFVISARATDGIIEAIEHSSKPFVLGVQWHPEGTWEKDPYSKKLFRAFIRATINLMRKNPRRKR
jgi:putative glutamine amidotransferase